MKITNKTIVTRKKILFIGSTGCDLIINYKKMPKIGETVFGNKFTQKLGGKGSARQLQLLALEQKLLLWEPKAMMLVEKVLSII